MGFFDNLGKAARAGKPNPYIAAGIVMGMGKGYSLKDAAMLGTMLGSQGAFDDEDKID